jgi:two-component system, OmpR family, response regulator
VDSNSVEVIVARLRRKIGHGLIKTVRGLGYQLTAEPS